ncbi:hypothetical protein CJT46_16500 [Pseudomonas aeruginosa]|uniref:PD-(D/E)XK nuclease domain-containing protein n=1 Tax=Pseudomonas aeruginosa TaxID=287 RepID=UPI000BB80192|nr:PD-(D/E)XK nuclease domain-containing protein [Pseudomonas aeruginosa]PBY83126.1 hypothetical protein CJT46_16500 [Pseudomonas aeruginosa]
MTIEPTFTYSEKSHIERLRPGNSGSSEDQFIQEVIDFYRYWQSKRSLGDYGSTEQALLMIFAETPDVDLGLKDYVPTTISRIRRRSGTVSQGIAVCNQNFRLMVRLLDALTVDEAYDFIEHHLGDQHTFVIAKFGQQTIQIHRAGQPLDDWIHEPDEILIKSTDENITPNSLAEDLRVFHHEWLSTPRAIGARTMWELNKTKTQYDLRSGPERSVQSYLLTYLRASYRRSGVFVNEEINNQGGRTDLYVQRETSPGSNKQINTVIELKVLSPKKSFERNLEWAKEGITQAKGYANANTDAAFACLYDARRNKLAMPELPAFALANSVRLEHYEMEVPLPPPKKKPAKMAKA